MLSDQQKRNSYDQFGHAGTAQSPFGQGGGYTYTTYGDINDIFSQFGGDFNNPFDIFESVFGFRNPGARNARKPVYHLRVSFDEAARGIEKTVQVEDGMRKRIKVPAGVDTGTRIQFTDFTIVIEVEGSQQFQRDGQDLYYEARVDYTDLILGTSLEVPTLKKPVHVRIKPGTEPGTLIRLRSFGMPYPQSNRTGDLYIVENGYAERAQPKRKATAQSNP